MQCPPSSAIPGPEKETDPPATEFELRIAIAYDDLSARQRALRLLGHLEKSVGTDVRFDPRPWSFDLLTDASYSELAAKDATEADILVITSSTADDLPPEVSHWAQVAFSRKRGTRAAVVALFGSEENPERPDSPQLQSIQTAARQAGLDFFAPSTLPELNESIARIHERAEAVTPVLESILHRSMTMPSPTRTPTDHERPTA